MPGAFTTASGDRSQAEQTPAARRVDVDAGSGVALKIDPAVRRRRSQRGAGFSNLGPGRELRVVGHIIIIEYIHPMRPIVAEKKRRTWLETPVSPRFAFSKPVSEGLIREVSFESDYREPNALEIVWSLPKILRLLDYHRLRECSSTPVVLTFVVFSPLLSEALYARHSKRRVLDLPRNSRL
jgi:hypothetical protein